MKYYLEYARKVFLIISAIIVSLLIFISSSALHVNQNIFNPSFHGKLFVKHDIYSGVTYILDNSITKFIAYIKQVSPDSYTQQKDIFDMLEQTTSREAVTRSIDYLREGIYEYLSDQRKFLPDIVLRSTDDTSVSAAEKSSSNFFNISKVNLGAVLMYANRNDIVDYLAFTKLVFDFSSRLPNLTLPLLLLFFTLSFGLFKNFKELFKWLKLTFISSAILFATAIISLFIMTYFWLPRSILPVTMVLSMDSKPVLAYAKDCVNPYLIFGAVIFLTSVLLVIANDKLHDKFKILDEAPIVENDTFQSETQIKIYSIIKISLFIFVVILLSSSFGIKVNTLAKDFNENDYASVIYKMRGVETISEVIPAKDDLVHDVQVKVVDAKTEEPVKDIRVNVTGKNGDNGKEYSDSQVLDKAGLAKFSLDKGTFKLSFYSPTFPAGKYKLPGSVFFELNTPGTKVITINLESVQTSQTKTGFAEIEILDPDNKPLGGIELQLSSEPSTTGHPDSVSSVSNSQGIAVFKLNEANYTVKFNTSKLPAKYTVPDDFTITIKPEKTSRYTIKLVER